MEACAVMSRMAKFTVSVYAVTLSDSTFPSSRAQKCGFCARNARKRGFRRVKAHKNLDFVLEMPENGGSEGQKRTKMPILCSGGAKTKEISPFLTQKCRFCARETNAGLRETESAALGLLEVRLWACGF